MANLKHWLDAFRLRTLPLALSGIIVGNFIAADNVQFSYIILLLSTLTAVLLQILSNLANDLGDGLKGTDNPNRVGPQRTIQSGKITSSEMIKMIVFFAVLSIISGATLIFYAIPLDQIRWVILYAIFGLASIIAAIKYTVGKSAYGYRGLGDLFVFLFFGIVAVVGSYFLQTNSFHPSIIFPAIAFGLFSTGVLNINNMRDIKNDTACGKMTIPVRIGIVSAKFYHLSLIVVGLILLSIYLLTIHKPTTMLLFLPVLPMFILHINSVFRNSDRDLDPELKRLSLSTFALSVLFAIATTLF